MSEFVHVKLRLNYPGATLSSFGWIELREFMDHVVLALAAMPGAPDAHHVLPVALEEGSIGTLVRMPRPGLSAVHALQMGPNRRWSRETRRAAEPLYDYLHAKNATLDAGIRKLKRVTVPDATPRWQRIELTSARGTVHKVGGYELDVVVSWSRSFHRRDSS